jgi:hypothetical protein
MLMDCKVILKELVYNIMDICGSAPHSLLATGRVDAAHPDLATDPLGILRPPSKLCHSLPLVCILPSETLPL